MDRQIMEETTHRSLEGTMTFGEVVMKLMAAGVESSFVDLVRMEKTYYMPDGQSYRESFKYRGNSPSLDFSADEVVKAIRASQKGEIKYVEFLDRVINAGTTQYGVFIDGKKAVYTGRKGDSHVEHFPK